MNIERSVKVMIIGGHLTPALALIEELKAQNINNLIWLGVKHSQTTSVNLSAEYKEVEKFGIPFIEFKSGKLWRKWTLKTFHLGLYQLLLIPWGFIKAFFVLLKYRPKLVIGFGGYLQLPIIFWARILGIYSVVHEQTSIIGTANRYAGKFSNRIFISWANTISVFEKDKVVFCGNLLRKGFFEKVSSPEKIFDNLKPIVLITGGNQGANTINKRVFPILPSLLTSVNIIHQVGNSSITNDLQAAEIAFNSLAPELKKSYKFFAEDFVNFNKYMRSADLVVSRSGANTISEILALGKLAILIPIPWSSQAEQQKNAEIVVSTGLGYILKQYDEMPPQELYNAILLGLQKFSNNQDFLGQNIEVSKQKAKTLVSQDSAKVMIQSIFKPA